MTGGFLMIATSLTGALAVAAAAALWRPRGALQGVLAVCLAGALTAFLYLAGGAAPEALALPLGAPGMPMGLALDGLSGVFLLLLMLAAAAAAAAMLDHHDHDPALAGFFALFIAGMALCLLGADAFALVLGFEVMSLASFALLLTSHRDPVVRGAALLYLGVALIGAVCLVPALGLLSGHGWSFAAMRAHPPAGWRAALVLALVLIGAGAKAGFAPLHVWLPPAHAAAPGPVSALMSGAMTKVALYVLIRVVFDLCGPAQPMWWGMPLLAVGAAGAVLGGLRAGQEGDLKAVLACSTIEHVGFIAIGLGLALAARAVDLPALAALALGGALLHALAHGTFKPLLFIAAGAVQHSAGSRQLDRLGGLIHGMPRTTMAVLLGAACLAGLPPSAGFAGEWTLLQALIAAPRIGGIFWQTLVCAAAALMALAAALAGMAAVRLVGAGFLGRPRSPRGAAAEEAGAPALAGMAGLAAMSVLIGLFPGAVLRLVGPAERLLLRADLVDRAGAVLVAPQAGGPGYAALGIAILLGLALALVLAVTRRRMVAGQRRGPAWGCGFAPAPAWLPFGDPLTQYGAASFAQPLARTLGATLLGARTSLDMPEPGDPRPARLATIWHDPADTWLFRPVSRLRAAVSALADGMQFLTIRRTLTVMFLVLVVFLTVIAVLGQL